MSGPPEANSEPAPHGTLSRYHRGGCRCVDCRAAEAEYNRRRRRERRVWEVRQAQRRGESASLRADAAPVREMARCMRAYGVPLRRIEGAAGIPEGSLSHLERCRRVKPEKAEAVEKAHWKAYLSASAGAFREHCSCRMPAWVRESL